MNGDNPLVIQLEDNRTSFQPGQTVSGGASWNVDRLKSAEVRLFWYTTGRGTRDAQIIASQQIPNPPPAGQTTFSFQLPDEPYSFTGKLISLHWAIELVIESGDHAASAPLTLTPTGSEIILGGSANSADAGTF
jgi:hypothetical protein